ncbi:hypothetical protein [Streptomyces sp. NPDC048392]|uniref:hypothetical protein n=1 Tax=Streptomyces sp. NPDC048392 TaxID=3365543 RepID=UPI0037247C9E
MRLFTRTSPFPRSTAAAALRTACACASAALLAPAVLAPAVPAYADAPLPACTAPDDHTFPLTTRLHGGPAGYDPGGGFGVWYLDLTNTTSRACEGIHPVVVLVDDGRALEPSQPRLEFFDGDRPHAVTFERTDRDELIGAFGEGEEAGGGAFPGFTVGPGKTLTVKVRLALTSKTAPGEVTANAAVVQRRGGDGEWIGQSNDYRFHVGTGAPADEPAAGQDSGPATPSVAATPDDQGTGIPFADELAGTGLARLDAVLVATALLVAAGGAAVLVARRRR